MARGLAFILFSLCITLSLSDFIPIVLMHGVAQGNSALDIVVDWIAGLFLSFFLFLFSCFRIFVLTLITVIILRNF
jgi:hypothetical protein